MQFQISEKEVQQYYEVVMNLNKVMYTEYVPGNLVMHKVRMMLDVPNIISNQATFKNEVCIGEMLKLDLFQANDVIEYKVTAGRQLKMAGTMQLNTL